MFESDDTYQWASRGLTERNGVNLFKSGRGESIWMQEETTGWTSKRVSIMGGFRQLKKMYSLDVTKRFRR